jgi:hypothetical protein
MRQCPLMDNWIKGHVERPIAYAIRFNFSAKDRLYEAIAAIRLPTQFPPFPVMLHTPDTGPAALAVFSPKAAFPQTTPFWTLRNEHFHRKVDRMKKLAVFLLAVVLAIGAISLWIAFEHGYLPRSSFNSEEWKRAENAEGYPRLAMVDSLIQSGQLDDKAEDEVLTLLGPPTDTKYFSDWDAVYWLGPERGFLRLDSEWLVLRFDAEGRVSDYRLVRD